MKKNYIVLFLALVLSTLTFAQNYNAIEPELQKVLNQRGEELIDIQIYFKSSVDSKQLNQATRKSQTKSEKKKIVVKELKSFAKDSQADVMNILKAEELNGNVSDINSLWIVNTINCKASSDVIYKLSSHPDVKFIIYDKEIQMISPEDKPMNQSIDESKSVRGPFPQVTSVNADDVWNLGYTGKNVVVAVLDSGTNTNHIDLKDHLWLGYIDTNNDGTPDTYVNGWNFTVENGGNSDIIDEFGHGTHCAGIVCGDGTSLNNTGIAPDALLMTVKTVGRAGSGTVAQMLSGVQFAVENGADILSMSLGFKNSQITTAQKEEIRFAFDNVLAAGVVVCAAAGNDGNTYGAPHNVDYPAACPAPWRNPDQTLTGGVSSVICVGAHDLNMSSRGPSTWEGTSYNDYPYNEGASMGLIRPDISALGNMIYSSNHSLNDKYTMLSGTSQATPCVAGVIALMLEKNSTLTPAQISQIIEETATSKPAVKNNTVGAGIVDALAAVNSITETVGNPHIQISSFNPQNIMTGVQNVGVTMINKGAGASDENTSVTLSLSNDPYVTIANPTQTLGRLGVNATKTLFFELNIDENTPSGHTATFSIKTTSGNFSWDEIFSVKISTVPSLAFKSVSPGVVKYNETAEIHVTMVNDGTADFTNPITLKLLTTNYDLKYVTLIDDETTIPALGVGETGTGTFTIETKQPTYPYDFFLETYSESTVSRNYVYEFENDLEGWTYLSGSYSYKAPWLHSTAAGAYTEVGESNSGKGHLKSISIIDGTAQQNNSIDNYLVSPTKIKVGENTKVSFYARANNDSYYKEHFGFAVSTAGNTSVSDFTTIQEWVITNRTTWTKYIVDLSEYAGQEIYVAIRHFFPNQEWVDSAYGQDLDALDIDDITFENAIIKTQHISTLSYDDPYYFKVTANSSVVLPMVENLTATALSSSKIELTWDATEGVKSYNVYRDGQNIATVTETTFEDTKLSHETQYCYTVTTITNSGESGFSDEACATTLEPTEAQTPTNLNATAESGSTIVLTWDESAEAASYNVYQGTELIKSELTATMYIVNGLEAETEYCFSVSAVNKLGESAKSESACATTLEDSGNDPIDPTPEPEPDPEVPTLAAPVVTAEATSDTTILLTWDAVEGAMRYNIYSGDETVKLAINATSYTITGLEADTQYCFNVVAVNRDGKSDKSEDACATTLKDSGDDPIDPTPDPEVPTLAAPVVTAEATSDTTILLTWDAVEGAMRYNIYSGDETVKLAINATSYTITGLEADTQYCFNVVAVNRDGKSDKSEDACATTLKAEEPAKLDAPTNLRATIRQDVPDYDYKFEITVAWDAVEGAKGYDVFVNTEKEQDFHMGYTNGTAYVIGTNQETTFEFYVVAFNDETESDPSEIYTVVVEDDAIEEVNASFNVYPNPVNDKLVIETEEIVKEVVVYDVYGRQQDNKTTRQQGNLSVDVTNLNSGVYFVKVVTENGEAVQRFIKK